MKILSIKAIAVFLAIFINEIFSQAQDINGRWNGVLSVQGMNLRLVFHINQSGDEYTSTMDSPDQGAAGIPVTTTTFEGSKLSLAIPNLGVLYEGEFKTDSIVGTFRQGEMSVPMTLKRTQEEIKSAARSQEPKPPYPYRSEDITFENKTTDDVTLAGTLTMPATGSNFTAVILITGSGAQNRDEEVAGHKPFLVTADFAADAESAIEYLKTRKEINPQKIGLLGHSEGGVLAPMVAAQSKDVVFIVMLAGTGVRGDALFLLQQETLYRVLEVSEEQIADIIKLNTKIFDKIVSAEENLSQQEITDFIATLKSDIVSGGMSMDNYNQFAVQISSPWMQYFMRYDPVQALEKVKCPVLAVNGSKDVQVPAKENLPAISAALKKGGNNKMTVKEYPNLNHLFQECDTGSPNEYATIEQTFSSDVLKKLSDWTLTH